MDTAIEQKPKIRREKKNIVVEENVKAAGLDMDESHLNVINNKIDSLTLEKNIS